ncbi:MAG: GntR family transcriptional regulator [Eubacteriales bacterium]|nr:GntR family transcriptional regulator [Eubacteriales bacterium]
MPDLKYIQLADELQAEIKSGAYEEGQRLPSENELAARTGYSRQTVRKAMEVLEKAGLTNRVRGSGTFVKNPIFRRDRTHNIAVVTTYIGEYIFPTILHGIDHVLAKNGYTSLLSATRNRVDNERRVLEDLLEKPIDGMIIEGTKTALPNPNIDLYVQFERQGIPVVFINGFYPEVPKPIYVVADDREGGRRACRMLLEKGHRHIAGIFKSDDIQGHRRYAGYAEALLAAGLCVKDDHVLWYGTENRNALLETNLKQVARDCTAIICYNDEVALKVIELLGPDIQRWELVSFDHSTFAKLSAVPFTSLCSPKERLGRLAAQKLLNILAGKQETSEALPWTIEEQRI